MDPEDNPGLVRCKSLQETTLAVLAGGASRRMGSPKAMLPLGGVTLIEWIVRRLGPSFAETLVATGAGSPLPESLEPFRVLDAWPGAGPLAGIEAALRAASRETVLCLACDLPLATADLARRLVAAAAGHQAAVPCAGGRPQPTCAVYARASAPALAAALERGERRLIPVVASLDVVWVEGVDERALTNLNTPADFARLLAEVQREPARDERP